MKVDRGDHHLRVGKLIIDWRAQQVRGARPFDGCITTLVEATSPTGPVLRRETFGGFIYKPRTAEHGYSIGWLNKAMLNTNWFGARYIARRIRWRLFGVPVRPARPEDGCSFVNPCSVRESLDGQRFKAVGELRRIAREVS